MADPDTKICTKCYNHKELTEFSARSDNPGKYFSHCKPCRRKHWSKYSKKHNEERRDKYANDKEYRKKVNDRNKAYNRSDSKWRNSVAREAHQKKRREVIFKYGGKCVCCEESHYEFLAIDHVDCGGSAHRKSGVGSSQLVRNLWKSEEVDTKYQILCHNCNSAKGNWGYCPHEKD